MGAIIYITALSLSPHQQLSTRNPLKITPGHFPVLAFALIHIVVLNRVSLVSFPFGSLPIACGMRGVTEALRNSHVRCTREPSVPSMYTERREENMMGKKFAVNKATFKNILTFTFYNPDCFVFISRCCSPGVGCAPYYGIPIVIMCVR
jgi:hypothetical protein